MEVKEFARMRAKEFARIEMEVILGERQSYMEQGYAPRSPSLQEVWSRLPALVAGAQQAEAVLEMAQKDPAFAEYVFAQMDAAEQQAVAA